MKNIKFTSLLVIFILLHGQLFAQDGIDFKNISFKEALEIAKNSNKSIFMDCYTSWCAPCKMMNTTVFNQKVIGDYFNDKFVNVKFDMEKGEGIELMKRYKMDVFPTYLLINANGDETHRVVGGHSAEDFIKLIKSGTENSIFDMTTRFENGDYSREFLMSYIIKLGEAYKFKNISPVLDQLFERYHKDLKKEDWEMIRKYLRNPNSYTFNFILENREQMNDQFGEIQIDEKISKTLAPIVFNMLNDVINGNKEFNKQDYSDLRKIVKHCNIDKKEYFEKSLDYLSYYVENDIKGCFILYNDYFSKLPSSEKFAHTLHLNAIVCNKGTKQDCKAATKILKEEMVRLKIPADNQLYNTMLSNIAEKEKIALKEMNAKSFIGQKAPEFFVKEWISKEPKMKNKFILLEFWATWCGPCWQSIDKLNSIHKEFKKDVVMIGISDENREKIISMKSPQLEFYSATDPKRTMNKAYGITAIPHAVIINPQGIVVWEGFPLLEDDPLTADLIKQLLSDYKKNGI